MNKKPDLTSCRPLLPAAVSVVPCLGAGSCHVDEEDDDDSRLELSVSGSEFFCHPSFPDSVLTSNNSGLWLHWFSLPTNPPDDVIYC